jgi:hypothetical protein
VVISVVYEVPQVDEVLNNQCLYDLIQQEKKPTEKTRDVQLQFSIKLSRLDMLVV